MINSRCYFTTKKIRWFRTPPNNVSLLWVLFTLWCLLQSFHTKPLIRPLSVGVVMCLSLNTFPSHPRPHFNPPPKTSNKVNTSVLLLVHCCLCLFSSPRLYTKPFLFWLLVLSDYLMYTLLDHLPYLLLGRHGILGRLHRDEKRRRRLCDQGEVNTRNIYEYRNLSCLHTRTFSVFLPKQRKLIRIDTLPTLDQSWRHSGLHSIRFLVGRVIHEV